MWFSETLAHDDPLLDADIPLGLSAAAIEASLVAQPPFDASSFRRQAARWAEGNVPMMAVSFQRHLLRDKMVPTFEEYVAEYEADNRDTLASLDSAGLRHRVARAYPSLVRDVHFVASVREAGVEAHRTLRMDLAGVDATIGPAEVPVRLYFASATSKEHKLAKAINHGQVSGIVDLGLTPEVAVRVGNLSLYSPRIVRDLLAELGLLEDEK